MFQTANWACLQTVSSNAQRPTEMNKVRLFILTIIVGANISAQTTNFLKVFNSAPNYTIIELAYPALDTLSKNSFVTTGCKIRFAVNAADTLSYDSYMQKTEVSGLTKWHRMYHLNGYSLNIKDVKVLPNKEILCAGQTNDFFNSDGSKKHGILMKTDSTGYVQWCRIYPRQKIFKLLKRSDGNIGVLASDSGGFYGKNLKLALLNPSGNLIWCKRLVSPDSGFAGFSIIEGKNKSFLINSNNSLLILLDSLGNHVNDLVFSPSSVTKGFYRATNYYNQNYYITGYYNSTSLYSTITKTDPSLNIIWHKTYQSLNGNSEFHNILPLAPNNLLVFCEPENYGTSSDLQRCGFAFFDSSGVFKKSHLFTTDSVPILPAEFIKLNDSKILFNASWNYAQFFGIVDTANGSFCKQTQITWNNVAGSSPINTNSFTSINSTFNYSLVPVHVYQPFDMQIDYFCSSGPVGPLDPTSIGEEDLENDVTLFPSPTSDFLCIHFDSETKKHKSFNFKLINSGGQQIMTDRFYLESKSFLVDLRKLSSGIYYFEYYFDSDKPTTKKIIVSK